MRGLRRVLQELAIRAVAFIGSRGQSFELSVHNHCTISHLAVYNLAVCTVVVDRGVEANTAMLIGG